MLTALISILGIFITIFFVIGTHEAGHFAAARLLNIKVLRFSIGFGKKIWSWQDKKGTEYVLALMPLGGYVKMLDETEGNVPPNELPFAFNRQPYYKKFLVVAAGPFINLVCAFLLYWLIFVIGFVTVKPIIGTITPNTIAAESGLKPNQEITQIDDKPISTWTGVLFRLIAYAGESQPLTLQVKNLADNQTSTHQMNLREWNIDGLSPDLFESLGFKPYEPPIPLVIGTIQSDSPASGQLKIGDKITAINKIAITNWVQLMTYVSQRPNQAITLTLIRDGKIKNISLTLGTVTSFFSRPTGRLGVAPNFTWPTNLLRTVQYSPLHALSYAWQEIVDLTKFNFLLFGKMLTGKLSMQTLGGPITIFESAGSALNSGFIAFLSFLAFLSISIGIINVLPIPGLDGGHLLIQTIEFIVQRPLSEYTLGILYRLGFAFIIFIFIQALVNDILRLS